MQPLTYIIAMFGKDQQAKTSQANLAKTLDLAQRWQWNVQVWPAVRGVDVTAQSWSDIGVKLLHRGAIQYRPGAQGCWFSHWTLWNHCVNIGKPLVILEHDAAISAPWPDSLDLEHCVWKLHRPDGRGARLNEITGAWSCGAWAYTLTPKWAQQLIDFSRSHGAQAVDKQLGQQVVPWQYWHTDLCPHQPKLRSSTTSPKVKNKINITD
jgi:hypothetical protein